MRTPFGTECPYFYGDYFRGKNLEECRLIGHHPSPDNWTPDLCSTCPVPRIRMANECTFMQLNPEITKKMIFSKRKVKITAFCIKSQSVVAEPHIGCSLCHIKETG